MESTRHKATQCSAATATCIARIALIALIAIGLILLRMGVMGRPGSRRRRRRSRSAWSAAAGGHSHGRKTHGLQLLHGRNMHGRLTRRRRMMGGALGAAGDFGKEAFELVVEPICIGRALETLHFLVSLFVAIVAGALLAVCAIQNRKLLELLLLALVFLVGHRHQQLVDHSRSAVESFVVLAHNHHMQLLVLARLRPPVLARLALLDAALAADRNLGVRVRLKRLERVAARPENEPNKVHSRMLFLWHHNLAELALVARTIVWRRNVDWVVFHRFLDNSLTLLHDLFAPSVLACVCSLSICIVNRLRRRRSARIALGSVLGRPIQQLPHQLLDTQVSERRIALLLGGICIKHNGRDCRNNIHRCHRANLRCHNRRCQMISRGPP
eukprot:comp15920_c0_seq1/m.24841 comp15920_c0_seq1/g.24841  ORF comp15920_c0_seq1/g.24841 comp15920_c0_seq1/m.24841 type:complete len:385 (+) comp15920_c0_seq1:219-1373(+)